MILRTDTIQGLQVWGQSWGSPRTFSIPLWPLPSGPQRPALMTGISFSGILGLSLCPGSFPAGYHHCHISVPIPKLCAPLTPAHALPPSDILPALPLLSLALPELLLLYLRPRPVASPGRLLTLLHRLSDLWSLQLLLCCLSPSNPTSTAVGSLN